MGTTHTAIKIPTAAQKIIFSRRATEEISTCKLDDGRKVYSKKNIVAQKNNPAAKNFSCIYSAAAICSGEVIGSFLIVSVGEVTRLCVPA